MTPEPEAHGRRAVTGVDFRARLASGLDALALTLAERQQADLLRFLGLLVKWNAVYNLTSVRDPEDMLTVHLLDAVSVVPWLVDHPGAILDVGSGAGLPAIPLAIALPGRTVHSVDAVAKKIAFQTQVKAALPLSNLHPHHSRIEALTLEQSPAIIVSRAYAALADMLISVDHLCDARTTVLAMKGAVPSDELRALPTGWRHVETRVLDVPYLGAARCIVALARA